MRYHIAIELDEVSGRFIIRLMKGPKPYLLDEVDMWEGASLEELEEGMKLMTDWLRKDMARYYHMQQAGFVLMDIDVNELDELRRKCRQVKVIEVYTKRIGNAEERRAVAKCVLQ